jgi:hypothetical protein
MGVPAFVIEKKQPIHFARLTPGHWMGELVGNGSIYLG